MRQLDLKNFCSPNLPYLLIGLYATKLGEAWRLAPGADASAKLLGLMDGFAAAFQSALPSFHPVDLLVGLCCGLPCAWLSTSRAKTPRNTARTWNTVRPAGVHNLKCKGTLHGRTGGYAHD